MDVTHSVSYLFLILMAIQYLWDLEFSVALDNSLNFVAQKSLGEMLLVNLKF